LSVNAFFSGLTPPPVVRQTAAKCWAAALASWLQVVRHNNVTADDLVSVFQEFLAFGGNGALRSEKFNDVATSGAVAMAWRPLAPGQLTHDFLAPFLDGEDAFFGGSHVYLVANFGNTPMSHARVLYRTVPYSNFGGGIYVMDPLMGYVVWPHIAAAQFRCMAGVRKECLRSVDGSDWQGA
jgi:hypothetical protein